MLYRKTTIVLVYRDLAVRNCLLGDHYLVKVADFGKSIILEEDEEIYIAKKGEKLPVKWSAPETLRSSQSSAKSDVWCKLYYSI